MLLSVIVIRAVGAFDVLLRTMSRPAHIERFPLVNVMSVAGLATDLTTLISRPALNETLPAVAPVIAALTLISRPQHTTKLPLVMETAALMLTSPTAFNVSVAEPPTTQVSAEAMVISPRPLGGTPCTPALVVVMVTLVPPPACKAFTRSAVARVTAFSPEFGA